MSNLFVSVFMLIVVIVILEILQRIGALKYLFSNHSSKFEYGIKSFLYAAIAIYTVYYNKLDFNEITKVEWLVIAVSIIEAASNYINLSRERDKEGGNNK
ncbi:hypothetical protein [Paenibacillus macquariensis]|uniref:Holin n=1 Tax=Paenibacillus macquariensis TaxID=948756 RepID=A0ABY1JK52_9BACL|nr:hypothetical protein [Paenibacillus macquariensis]MEC0089865.1 hypothetical protein [Paenibacillus macquariensis]OAB30672.1 hypothetical protein PMSM_21235 [Paenibacillus macquariensis subsp. macquariensis]SIQ32939.1 hypothetical protein SAMN05421578_101245 [Paenibacillus macquariensis]